MEELLMALRVIKNECMTHLGCEECPLRKVNHNNNDVECHVRYCDPDKWNLISEVKPIKLFK